MLRGKALSAMTAMFLTPNLETGVEDRCSCLTLFQTVHISGLKLVIITHIEKIISFMSFPNTFSLESFPPID